MLASQVKCGIPKGTPNKTELARDDQLSRTRPDVPPHHRDGGLPLISDSVFSLIIMIYVLLAFFFVFFLFCWRRGPDRPFPSSKGVSECLLQDDGLPIVPGLMVTPP